MDCHNTFTGFATGCPCSGPLRAPRKPHRCPVCNGQGEQSRPPEVAGDVDSWASTNTKPYTCQACDGTGVVWR